MGAKLHGRDSGIVASSFCSTAIPINAMHQLYHTPVSIQTKLFRLSPSTRTPLSLSLYIYIYIIIYVYIHKYMYGQYECECVLLDPREARSAAQQPRGDLNCCSVLERPVFSVSHLNVGGVALRLCG